MIVNSSAPGYCVAKLGERVGGETVTTHVDLGPPGHEPGDITDGRFHHGETIERRRDHAGALLLPRHAGHHQHDQIEVEGMAHVDGSDQMADVRRVEGAPNSPIRRSLWADPGTISRVYGFFTGFQRNRPCQGLTGLLL